MQGRVDNGKQLQFHGSVPRSIHLQVVLPARVQHTSKDAERNHITDLQIKFERIIANLVSHALRDQKSIPSCRM